eukprot:59847_1
MIKSKKKYKDIDNLSIEFTEDKKLENSKKYYAPMCNGCYGNYNMYVHVFDATPCILHIFRCPFLFFKYVAATVSSWIVRERNKWIHDFKTKNKNLKLTQKDIENMVPKHLLSSEKLEQHYKEHCQFDLTLDIEYVSASDVKYVGGIDVKNMWNNRKRFKKCDECAFSGYTDKNGKPTA